jgi:hypothetical protein
MENTRKRRRRRRLKKKKKKKKTAYLISLPASVALSKGLVQAVDVAFVFRAVSEGHQPLHYQTNMSTQQN